MAIFKFGGVSLLLLPEFAESDWSATIVGGDVIAHWSGKGHVFEMENYRKFFLREVNGMLEEGSFLRASQGLFNRTQICCQVSMNVDPKTEARESFGNVHDFAPGHTRSHPFPWTCKSLAETCNGEFTWM